MGVISRSGTLTYEIVYHLTANGMGQSTAIGIGGDPVVGLHFRELLEMFQNDTETEAIVELMRFDDIQCRDTFRDTDN